MTDLGDMLADYSARRFMGCIVLAAALAALLGILIGALL